MKWQLPIERLIIGLVLINSASGCGWNTFYDSMGGVIPDVFVEVSTWTKDGSLGDKVLIWGENSLILYLTSNLDKSVTGCLPILPICIVTCLDP